MSVCPHCSKTYKNVNQHITKSHSKIIITFNIETWEGNVEGYYKGRALDVIECRPKKYNNRFDYWEITLCIDDDYMEKNNAEHCLYILIDDKTLDIITVVEGWAGRNKDKPIYKHNITIVKENIETGEDPVISSN